MKIINVYKLKDKKNNVHYVSSNLDKYSYYTTSQNDYVFSTLINTSFNNKWLNLLTSCIFTVAAYTEMNTLYTRPLKLTYTTINILV